jgi:hypothetical protein
MKHVLALFYGGISQVVDKNSDNFESGVLDEAFEET